jgi:Protein of unknown function (DUF3089)
VFVARKFLFFVAAIIGLILLAGVTWSLFSDRLIRAAMVPSAAFVPQKPIPARAYVDGKMWIARPDLPGNPALWVPTGFASPPGPRAAAVFFIHPTSYLDRKAWNAPLDDAVANDRANIFVRSQASAFSGVGEIWVPRYRQAAFGAFLTTQPEAKQALDAAYADVAAAFDQFLASIAADRPIILAGHSQGALHLTRLLRERVAGKPLARRIVAAYVVGWPVSVETDIAALGLPACASAGQPGCILSWQSFAEPADPAQVIAAYDGTTGFDGRPRRGTKMLCTNPLTGTPDSAADATVNQGALVPDSELKTATLEPRKVPARCDAQGFLLIGPPPEDIGTYVLPGNNYHVFDYALFWSNVRSDAAARLAAFQGR